VATAAHWADRHLVGDLDVDDHSARVSQGHRNAALSHNANGWGRSKGSTLRHKAGSADSVS
jgi:hypothetical protein